LGRAGFAVGLSVTSPHSALFSSEKFPLKQKIEPSERKFIISNPLHSGLSTTIPHAGNLHLFSLRSKQDRIGKFPVIIKIISSKKMISDKKKEALSVLYFCVSLPPIKKTNALAYLID